MKHTRSAAILICDTLRPVYLAMGVFLLMLFWKKISWPQQADALLGAALTVSSVVVGFLISAKAIIISSTGRPMQQIREMGLVVELVDAFKVAIYISMAFSVVCTVGFFDDSSRIFLACWMALGIAMLYSFLRICNVLFRIVSG